MASNSYQLQLFQYMPLVTNCAAAFQAKGHLQTYALELGLMQSTWLELPKACPDEKKPQ